MDPFWQHCHLHGPWQVIIHWHATVQVGPTHEVKAVGQFARVKGVLLPQVQDAAKGGLASSSRGNLVKNTRILYKIQYNTVLLYQTV